MATGDSTDIVSRVKRLIPWFWFSYVAPYRDAILGGLADSGAWCYQWIKYAQSQARLATANGPYLDIFGYDYVGRFITRSGNNDSVFRAQLKSTILQERVTRKGMTQIITGLVGVTPSIFEPWNPNDAGAYGVNMWGYGVAGGWGNMNLPGQFFMKVTPPGDVGVPFAGGYKSYPGGYGTPSPILYAGPAVEESGVPESVIYSVISKTKPTGTTAWVYFI